MNQLPRTMLDTASRVADVILTTTWGNALTEDGFRVSWGKACDKAGIDDVTFRDFRGSAVTRQFMAGATVAENRAFTTRCGSILDAHYFGRTTELLCQG
jgi:hypothetical protein